MALEQEQATVGTKVELIGQSRRGILGGEPVILTIMDTDELGSGKVACGWMDTQLHYQLQTFPIACLELSEE